MTFSKNNKNLLWRSTVLFKVWLDKGEENDYSSQIYYHKRKYLMAFSDNLGFSFWFLHTVNIILKADRMLTLLNRWARYLVCVCVWGGLFIYFRQGLSR